MGSDPVTMFGSLFLHYCQRKWIKKIIKTDIKLDLDQTVHFQTLGITLLDQTVLNDSDEIEHFRKFYPTELEFKIKNETDKKGSLLDVDIKIKDNRFSISLHNRQDDFTFPIAKAKIYYMFNHIGFIRLSCFIKKSEKYNVNKNMIFDFI